MMSAILSKMAYPVIGGVVGFVFYRFIGCSTGACPITSNPVLSTLYGMFLGFVLSAGR